MKYLSYFTIILSAIVLCISYLYLPLLDFMTGVLKCVDKPCLESYLNSNPKLQMVIFTTYGHLSELALDMVDVIRDFDYRNEFEIDYGIYVPEETRCNGTLYMYVIVGADEGLNKWKAPGAENSTMLKIPLSQYVVPFMSIYMETDDNIEEEKAFKPTTHLYEKVSVTLITEEFSVSQNKIPFDFRINSENKVLPVLRTDFFDSKLINLIELDPNAENFRITFHYKPIGIVYDAVTNMHYRDKNIDKIRTVVANTSLQMLALAVGVFILDVLFENLSFGSDILFWKRTKTYHGLSLFTTLLRTFGLFIVFLYSIDQFSSIITIISASIAVVIEIWKCKKMLKIEFSIYGIRKRQCNQLLEVSKAEKETQDLDKEAMRHLRYFLCPLFLGGTIYFLMHSPYTSWYCHIIGSLANSFYILGILFMFPQLYINYKQKSVASLPWDCLMYRAFNSFIDKLWPLILPIPNIFKITCFGDDIIFILFLYQRWLYPIGTTPKDVNLIVDDEVEKDRDIQQKV